MPRWIKHTATFKDGDVRRRLCERRRYGDGTVHEPDRFEFGWRRRYRNPAGELVGKTHYGFSRTMENATKAANLMLSKMQLTEGIRLDTEIVAVTTVEG